MGSKSFLMQFNAAKAIAGAVLRPNGSNKIVDGFTLIDLNCSATINRCSSLQIIIGSLIFFIPLSLKKVSCKREFSLLESRFKYCFGKDDLDKGHNLVPEPPERITGMILLFFILSSNLTKVFL